MTVTGGVTSCFNTPKSSVIYFEIYPVPLRLILTQLTVASFHSLLTFVNEFPFTTPCCSLGEGLLDSMYKPFDGKGSSCNDRLSHRLRLMQGVHVSIVKYCGSLDDVPPKFHKNCEMVAQSLCWFIPMRPSSTVTYWFYTTVLLDCWSMWATPGCGTWVRG
jgi:hypothetical protein